MQRPRVDGGVLELFGQEESPHGTPQLIPECIAGDGPTLRTGTDGRPWHETCEPRDARITDAPTSQQAAARSPKGAGSRLARQVHLELQARGDSGATDDELQLVFEDQPPGSVSKRRCDLVREGLVVDSGRTRSTRWGREAICWVAVR